MLRRRLQWNVERNYELAGIIEELKRIDADVISLQVSGRVAAEWAPFRGTPTHSGPPTDCMRRCAAQEVDVGCERSGGIDTGVAIAKALQLNYAFLSEFEELHSPLRSARTQVRGTTCSWPGQVPHVLTL